MPRRARSVRRQRRDVLAVETHSAARHCQAHEAPEQRRLAGAIAADERDDLAWGDIERDAEERLRAAVEGVEPGDLEPAARAFRAH